MFYEITITDGVSRQTLFVNDLSYVGIAYTILKHVYDAGTDDEVLDVAKALCQNQKPVLNGNTYSINLA